VLTRIAPTERDTKKRHKERHKQRLALQPALAKRAYA